MACGLGGDLQSKAGASTGFQSQSLKAAYQLRKAGWPKVYYIKVRRCASALCAALSSSAPGTRLRADGILRLRGMHRHDTISPCAGRHRRVCSSCRTTESTQLGTPKWARARCRQAPERTSFGRRAWSCNDRRVDTQDPSPNRVTEPGGLVYPPGTRHSTSTLRCSALIAAACQKHGDEPCVKPLQFVVVVDQ